MAKIYIAFGLLACFASLQAVAGVANLQCDKQPKMSYQEFEAKCKSTPQQAAHEYMIESQTETFAACACFFVHQHMLWAGLVTAEVRALSDSVRFSQELSPKVDVTSYLLIRKAHNEFILGIPAKNKVTVYDTLKYAKDLKMFAYEEDDLEKHLKKSCVNLSRRFAPFRQRLLKLGEIIGNQDVPLMIAAQEENLARVFVAADICVGAFKVNMDDPITFAEAKMF